MRSSQYSQLPSEEKEDQTEPQTPVTGARRSQLFIAIVTLLFTLALLTLVLGFSKSWNVQTEATSPTDPIDDSEWLRKFESRATGDEYLIGVGKADITGSVCQSYLEFLVAD